MYHAWIDMWTQGGGSEAERQTEREMEREAWRIKDGRVNKGRVNLLVKKYEYVYDDTTESCNVICIIVLTPFNYIHRLS